MTNSTAKKSFFCIVTGKKALWKGCFWFIIVLALLLIIVYWPFSFKLSSLWQEKQSSVSAENQTEQVMLSEAQTETIDAEKPVAASVEQAKEGSNFFIEYRLERDRNRSQQIEILQEIVKNPNSDENSRKEAYAELLAISQNLEKEMEVEQMIKAKGYSDAIVFINKDAVNVIVQSASLDSQRAAQIAEVVMRGTGIKPENISIVAKQ